MLPTASLTSLTATGDVVMGPGGIKYLTKGLPCACIGDIVVGPVCVGGAITVIITPINNIVLGRPQANITSLVAGVSAVGVPVATAIAVSININLLV